MKNKKGLSFVLFAEFDCENLKFEKSAQQLFTLLALRFQLFI